MNREIKYLFVHTTATGQTATPESISRYWKQHLGWKNPGYHILISPDGTKTRILPDEGISNGVGGEFNTFGLHVSYIGGVNKDGSAVDNRTEAQKNAIIEVLKEWREKYPKAEILGHRDAWFKYKYSKARKACPCFNAIEEYKNI